MLRLEQNGILQWATAKEGLVSSDRKVTAYTSDDEGNKVNTASEYSTIEMYVSPNDGLPFIYRPSTGFNSWCNPYRLHISGMEVDPDIDVEGDDKLCPQVDNWTMNTYQALDGIKYNYGEYRPSLDDKKHPLVIWLHGLGEGGTDPSIDLLANKVTALADEPFQNCMNQAYVLVPQCPTMWMDNGKGE